VDLLRLVGMGMDNLKSSSALTSLSLMQFLESTNQERPDITGGCVLLTGATLTTSMILMALKISRKKVDDVAVRRIRSRKINTIVNFQRQLLEAAAIDLERFDEYRNVLKSRSRFKTQKLISSLVKANDSLLEAAVLLNRIIEEAKSTLADVDETVKCDVEAGILVLDATFKGIGVLSDSNQRTIENKQNKLKG
jgi:formiminotetrahydrofolate cyclodeaminase